MAIMVSVAMLVIGAVAIFDRDVTAVSGAILTLLLALGLAELREIKTSTNGNTSALMEQNRALMQELAQYRRDSVRITDRALESAPLMPAQPQQPHMDSTSTTTTSYTYPQDPTWSPQGPSHTP